MSSELKNCLRYIVVYLLTTFIFSAFSIEVFVNEMPPELRSIGRISALFSMSFSVVTRWLTCILIIAIHWLCVNQLFTNVVVDDLFEGYKNAIGIFILSEFFKFSLVSIFLIDEVKMIDFQSTDIKNQIDSTSFGKISHISDYMSIIFASLIFGISLKINKSKIYLISTLFLLALFTLFEFM